MKSILALALILFASPLSVAWAAPVAPNVESFTECGQLRQDDTRPTATDIGWFKDADQLIPAPDENQAMQLFRRLANDKRIPFRYPEDGCYARAHEMARILESLGVECQKIFVEGDLKVKTRNSPAGEVSWWYHVAPMVRVMTRNQGLVEMVFDPSLFDHPVPVREWIEIQTRHNPKQKIKLSYRSRFTYGPGEAVDAEAWRPEDINDALTTMETNLMLQTAREKVK